MLAREAKVMVVVMAAIIKNININRLSVFFVEVSVIAIIVVAVVAIVHGSIPLLLLLLSAHERKPERGKKEENKEKQ